jgi:hypothetical protein
MDRIPECGEVEHRSEPQRSVAKGRNAQESRWRQTRKVTLPFPNKNSFQGLVEWLKW